MFQPVWLYLAFAAIVVGAGALLGTVFGWLFGLRSPANARRPMLDAAIGGAALVMLNVAINVADTHVTYADGRALGGRGLLLNHKLVWAILVIAFAVSARHFLARRAGRSRPSAPGDLGANGSSGHRPPAA